ncbi:hypothetical protein SAMN05192588_0877 [Nonlabens sp. Hel1_33_55]|uniref:hypothetical protein n=1 Tax=Nonlabens sp. Hel1_33_55 TaxID=1336802 RepID=UPI000875DEC3|nr:hypothetical protein [Nonlabens sp. Hel1_33_55]SCY04555.1 hypothetical protein SAMN05192588_0877 [Nonlabens sp. Hel1_33_55]
MKYTFLFVMFCMASFGHAQESSADISGSYHIPSNDPQGGSSIIISADHHFAIAYFGGIQKGTWEQNGSIIQFTFHKEPRAVLYAKKNSTVNDSVGVRVSMNDFNEVALRFNAYDDEPFIPLFNEKANCFTYPYIYKQPEALNQIDVYFKDEREYYEGEIQAPPADVYRFNSLGKYNDFILVGLSSDYSQGGSFTATFENNTLTMSGQSSLKKRSEYADINSEDLAYFDKIFNNELFPETLNAQDQFFPYHENPTDDDLKSFVRIHPEYISSDHIIVVSGSLFYAVCED